MEALNLQNIEWRGATINIVYGNQSNVWNVMNVNTASPSWQERIVHTLSTKQQIEANEQLKGARREANNFLQITLASLESLSDDDRVNFQISEFQAELRSLQKIIDTIGDVEVIRRLSAGVKNLNVVLGNAIYEGTIAEAMLRRINRLSIVWGAPIRELLTITSSSITTRLFWSYEDSIDGHLQTILWSMHSFTVESTLAIEFALDENPHNAKTARPTTTRAQSGMTSMKDMRVTADVEGYLTPPHAITARWDYNDEHNTRMACLQGTRVEILSQVYTWMNFDNTNHLPAHGQQISIFWINGSAGTGKTTIAYTVAEDCQQTGILGASFFCSYDDASSSNPSLIFTTIAYQLGFFHNPFKAKVSQALRSDPDVIYAGVPHQLKKLLVDPLSEVKDTFPPCVVILDALDECRDDNSTSIILSSLARYIKELFPIKFLITSRPVLHVTGAFNLTALHLTTQHCVLHEVKLDVVEKDIKQFISAGLNAVRQNYHIEEFWPTIEDVDTLKHLSSGLFIFAATALKFIGDKNYSAPKEQLTLMLQSNIIEGSSPQQQLDTLYLAVLRKAFPNISVQLVGKLKKVLGTVVLLRIPLSHLVLDDLLDLESGTVRQTLQHLHSVVIVPENNQVIRMLHPSFSDFLIDPRRCSDKRFTVTPMIQHTMLAISCFHAMTLLKRDICNIGDLSKLNTEIDDLSKRITQKIPIHVQYACCHWAEHLCQGMISEEILGHLLDFCSIRLLYWVEVCSILGELQNAIFALNAAQKYLATIKIKEDQIISLLHDCERFLQEFFPVLSIAAGQTYYTALPFTPSQTTLYDAYNVELRQSVKIHNIIGEDWHECLKTIEGHSDWVQSVGFSPNNTQIVSGSYDQTIKLWNAVTGACLNTLTKHSSSVLSVSFSFDGAYIVTGLNDSTIWIWSAFTGDCIKTLNGHSDSVQSVVFSPDGTKIVSGSYDTTVKLWNPVTGTVLQTFVKHLDSVYSVAFSADSSYVLSGSQDTTIHLYNAVSFTFIRAFKIHSDSVYSVAFSPDGAHFVSGSADRTIQLYQITSGTHVQTFRGHSGTVYSVAFSHDGNLIASGSSDRTIKLWNVCTGKHLNTFQGHSHSVYSVTFSTSDTQIVSGSDDKTVRIWDTVTSSDPNKSRTHPGQILSLSFSPDGTQVITGTRYHLVQLWHAETGTLSKTLKGHKGCVYSVVFSPDGLRAISGSQDATVQLWDLVNGAYIKTLKGHSASVQSVAISPNAMYIVSGSADTRVLLWDASGGERLRELVGHSRQVQSVSFSLDGRQIISGSYDMTVILWDTATGACLNTFRGHSGWIQSVAFSPDGLLIASGSYDKSIRLWNAANGDLLQTWEPEYMGSMFFSGDRRYIITPKDILLIAEPFWPRNGTAQTLDGYMLRNEWIYSMRTGRRICWIPVAYRGLFAFKDDRVALGTSEGTVVFLNVGGVL